MTQGSHTRLLWLERNAKYMAMVFHHPKRVIELFLREDAAGCVVLPLILFMACLEMAYALDYLHPCPPFFHVVARVIGIPDVQYNLHQVFLFPAVHLVDLAVFGGLVAAAGKLLRVTTLDTRRTVLLFMFIWNTVGLLGFVTETMAIRGGIGFLLYMQPIYIAFYFAYPMEFIHKQSGVDRLRSSIASMVGLTGFLGFRMLYLG